MRHQTILKIVFDKITTMKKITFIKSTLEQGAYSFSTLLFFIHCSNLLESASQSYSIKIFYILGFVSLLSASFLFPFLEFEKKIAGDAIVAKQIMAKFILLIPLYWVLIFGAIHFLEYNTVENKAKLNITIGVVSLLFISNDFTRRFNYSFEFIENYYIWTFVVLSTRLSLFLLEALSLIDFLILWYLSLIMPLMHFLLSYAKRYSVYFIDNKLLFYYKRISVKGFLSTTCGYWAYNLPTLYLGYSHGPFALLIFSSLRSVGGVFNIFFEQIDVVLPRYIRSINMIIRSKVHYLIISLSLIWFFGLMLILVWGNYFIYKIFSIESSDVTLVLVLIWVSIVIGPFSRIASLIKRVDGRKNIELAANSFAFLLMPIYFFLIDRYDVVGASIAYILTPLAILFIHYMSDFIMKDREK